MDPTEELRQLLEDLPGDPNLVRTYLQVAQLSSGDTIDFPESGVTVIVGANNAGKSTFLRQLYAFLQSGNANLPTLTPPLIVGASLMRHFAPADLLRWFAANGTLVHREAAHGGSYFAVNGLNPPLQAIVQGTYSQGYDSLQDTHAVFVQLADATSRLNVQFSSGARSSVDEPASTAFHRFQDERPLFARLSQLSQQVFDRPLLLDDYPGATIQIRVGEVDLPVPARNEPLGEFGRAVARLPRLDEQGDGMRSFFGLVLPLVAENKKIILVDEPEAFLHPPQARALGRELSRIVREKTIQLVVATHDKDFIAGLLDSDTSLTVVRLVRSESGTKVAQLSSDKLRSVWDDRNLRYSNVLDGLFARLVVICESDQDCRFYEAALDNYVAVNGDDPHTFTIPASDVLFIPSNGKSGFVNLIGILQDLAVPTVVVADIDVMRDGGQLRGLVEAMGGTWDDLDSDYRVATEALQRANAARSADSVLQTIHAVLSPIIDASPAAPYDPATRVLIMDQLNSTSDPWSQPKRTGVAWFRGAQRTAVDSLLDSLDRSGLIVVKVGELEGFAPSLSKNKQWLPGAISTGAHTNPDAQEHVRRILKYLHDFVVV